MSELVTAALDRLEVQRFISLEADRFIGEALDSVTGSRDADSAVHSVAGGVLAAFEGSAA